MEWEKDPMGIYIMLTTVRDRLLGERGASMVEYGLLLVLIAVVALVAVEAFGTGVSEKFSSINSSVN
jgi:Flp pilus assembly pilin Flp